MLFRSCAKKVQGEVSLLFCEVIIVYNHFSYSLWFYILKLTDNSSTLNEVKYTYLT